MRNKKTLIVFLLIFCMSLSSFMLWGCGLSYGWAEWETTLAPTCTQAGEETRCYSLKKGGRIETHSIEALGHDLLWMSDDAVHSRPYGICQRDGCDYVEIEDNEAYEKLTQRCKDCKAILNNPYTPKHNGNVKEGVFWELPIIRVGDSPMPMREWGFDDKDTSSGILVVDSFEQLNSLRIGSSNLSRPAAHNYSHDFFDNNALIFLTVLTPNYEEPQFLFFYALVTDSQNFYPVFGLSRHGMMTAIGERSFVIEVPRVIVNSYDVGDLIMGPGWTANWNNTLEGKVNWLCDECKSNWPLTPPSETIGIHTGENDSKLVQKNYDFFIINDRLHWKSPLGGEHEVYIQRSVTDHYEYLSNSFGNGGLDLLSLELTEGINTIKIVGSGMTYQNGEFIRYYDYYDLEKANGYVEENYQLSIDLSSIASKAKLTWSSASVFFVYVKRAGSTEFDRVEDRWGRFSTTGNNGVAIDDFGFMAGINIIKTVTYRFLDGKAIRCIAEIPLTLADETKVNYKFILGGGGTGIGGGGHFIGWVGTQQLYSAYIKCPGSNEFKYAYGDWDTKIGGGIVRFCNIADWWGEELQDGAHTLRIEGWQHNGSVLSKIVSEFEFEIRTQENSNIRFSMDNEKLRWDYDKPWYIHSLSVKRAGSDYFQLITTLATGGLESWKGIELKQLGLTSGANLARMTVAWSLSGNILTRHVGYFTINKSTV